MNFVVQNNFNLEFIHINLKVCIILLNISVIVYGCVAVKISNRFSNQILYLGNFSKTK